MSLDEYDRDTLAYLRGMGVKDALLERVERALADGARLRAERDAVLVLADDWGRYPTTPAGAAARAIHAALGVKAGEPS